jgi:hypothetical protein
MRAREFISEEDVVTLRKKIIQQVEKTDDEPLLVKLFTTLNRTGLIDRIAPVLAQETDTKGHVQDLVNLIIEVPGSYEDKVAFINGYPKGYVDIEKMLSGEYVKFDSLITSGEDKTTPIKFVRDVFNALKGAPFGNAKGPGEFALAVLSPKIKISGKGDLNIGNMVIEVKANQAGGGGRLGTGGLLNYQDIPKILEPYVTKYMIPEGGSLNLRSLSDLLNKNDLNSNQKKEVCTKLFNYIFKGEVETGEIVSAVVSNHDPVPYFIKANYEIYRKETNFDGMLLVNFPAQACKYFVDPLQMANEIYSTSIYLISSNKGNGSREILSQVTLRPLKEPKPKLDVVKIEKQSKLSKKEKSIPPASAAAPQAAAPQAAAPQAAAPVPAGNPKEPSPYSDQLSQFARPQSTLSPRTDSTWRQKFKRR